MSSPIINCPEVVGKTVSSLKLHATDCDSAEIVIEFTDGTSFSSAYESRAVHKAALDSDRCEAHQKFTSKPIPISAAIPPRNSGRTGSCWTLLADD